MINSQRRIGHFDNEIQVDDLNAYPGIHKTSIKPQADYIGVPVKGPFKPDSYRY